MSSSSMLLPCLAFHSVDDESTVLFSASEKKPIVGGDIGELENKIICPTTHGFMLARDPISMSTFLWNPQSRDKIKLPTLQLDKVDDDLLVDCTCLLSSKPSAPDCVVLLVEPSDPFICYCRAGDIDWEIHEYDIGTQPLFGSDPPQEKVPICDIAACRGKFYFNSMATSLGVIDFCGTAPVFSFIAIDDTIDENYGYENAWAKVFLLESHDDLYMVNLLCSRDSKLHHGATVHMMDFSTRRWRKVDDLSGRTFLLSMYEFGAATEGGESGLRKNCVYFMHNPKRKLLEIFNVKDGSAEPQEFEEAPTASDKAFWMLPADSTAAAVSKLERSDPAAIALC